MEENKDNSAEAPLNADTGQGEDEATPLRESNQEMAFEGQEESKGDYVGWNLSVSDRSKTAKFVNNQL